MKQKSNYISIFFGTSCFTVGRFRFKNRAGWSLGSTNKNLTLHQTNKLNNRGCLHIHPKKLTHPLIRGHFNRKVVFQPLFLCLYIYAPLSTVAARFSSIKIRTFDFKKWFPGKCSPVDGTQCWYILFPPLRSILLLPLLHGFSHLPCTLNSTICCKTPTCPATRLLLDLGGKGLKFNKHTSQVRKYENKR